MGAEKLLRTFLAVELPDQVKRTAHLLHTTVEARPKVVKWLKSSNIHLTLRFIGPTPEEEVPRIHQAVGGVISGHRDFTLRIEGTGVFPKKQRPRVLWMGVRGDLDSLTAMVREMNRALESLGYPPEEREYSPHVTIGRIRYPQKVTPDVSDFLNSRYQSIVFDVQKVTFFQSDLVPGGPIYSVLGVHELTPS
ncbi:MAG: RNA 2',3'-cyclic phosphodiesterase [Fidelibacterota bacterium]